MNFKNGGTDRIIFRYMLLMVHKWLHE